MSVDFHAMFEERTYNMNILLLWRHVQENLGEDVRREVKTFTFRDEFLSEEHAAENKATYRDGRFHPVYSGETHHNCVRLNSGELLEIPLFPRPQIPGHMKVDVQEKLV
ncbi:MAG: hypothetical protein ACYS7Y_19165 [Planctomycetota bacterium]|jgi:hypothetical protein